MAAEKPKENQEQFAAQCIEALYEKDRLNYAGEFVQGFVHNTNGPLQNLTMLAEMALSGLEIQDKLFQSSSGENEKWLEMLEKQRKRLSQMREQISNMASDLREFMHLHEAVRSGTEIDINAMLTRMVRIFRANLFFKHHVKLDLRLGKNLPHIRARGKDIIPAIFHLFHNAVTAMKESPKKELTIESEMQAGEIVVRMTDSGCGIGVEQEPEALFALFESKWPQKEVRADARELHLGFGLYAARQLLAPYGFTVALETRHEGVSAVIRMPLPSRKE